MAAALPARRARHDSTVGIGHVLYIAARIAAREKLGQPRAAAADEVARREREAAVGALGLMDTGHHATLRAAVLAWAARHAPNTSPRHGNEPAAAEDADAAE